MCMGHRQDHKDASRTARTHPGHDHRTRASSVALIGTADATTRQGAEVATSAGSARAGSPTRSQPTAATSESFGSPDPADTAYAVIGTARGRGRQGRVARGDRLPQDADRHRVAGWRQATRPARSRLHHGGGRRRRRTRVTSAGPRRENNLVARVCSRPQRTPGPTRASSACRIRRSTARSARASRSRR